jgi:signal transduction histidine kinase
MDMPLLWSLAETGYGVMAIAAAAASWCIWQRATAGRETTLFASSVAAIGLHYGCLAVDASHQAARVPGTSVTVWYAFGHMTLLLSGGLLLTYLLAMVTRRYAPTRTPIREVGSALTIMQVAVVGAAALWVSTRLVWSLISNANSEIVDARIENTVSVLSSAVASLIVPLAYLSGMLYELPTRRGPVWLLRPKRAASWPVAEDDTRTEDDAEMPATYAIRVIAGAFVLTACVLSGRWWSSDRAWTAWSLAGFTTLRLLLLPSLLAFVYFHARFLFFDVLVKRGVVLLVLAGLLTITVFGVGMVMTPLPVEVLPWLGLSSVLATLVVSSSTIATQRVERWVDRVWFQRRNYREEFPAISAAMALCNTTEALTSTVTSRLKETLDAAFVRVGPSVADATALVVPMRSLDRARGVLELGPRVHGQPYGSEDLTFVDAVVAQFTARLHAFDAQESARLTTAAELRALRAQINPHFLFNALNTLAEMSHGQPATERAILNLSQVFRYALESTQHERVPLEAEIEAIRAYLEIEAERFDDRLRYEIHVADDVCQIPIPPMLLQPLVENAITHGLSEKVCGGLVRITAQRENGHLRLTVQDDGVGFDRDRTSPRVGLTNVSARIERTGGSCQVQSIPGAGTLVTLAVMP